MIAIVAGWLVKFGLSQTRADKLAPLGLGLALLLLVVAGGALWLHFHDQRVIERDRMEANLEQLEDQVKADTKAADQRLEDAAAQDEQEEAYANAIDNPAPGDAGDPGVRLACERLRRSGQDTTGLPACGGR